MLHVAFLKYEKALFRLPDIDSLFKLNLIYFFIDIIDIISFSFFVSSFIYLP